MIVGICGREGAGKTTIANYLTGEPSQSESIKYKKIYNVEEYIIDCLFKFPDAIWGLSPESAKQQLLELFQKYIDSNFTYPAYCQAPILVDSEQKPKWISFSFADPLKIVAAAIFELDYEMLLGSTEVSRKERETTFTRDYNICGKLSGRQCLEYLGTNVFRNHFDAAICSCHSGIARPASSTAEASSLAF